MFCPHCGSQIADGSAFCPSCGVRLNASAPAAVSEQPAASSSYKDYQTFSIIVSIVSFLCCGGWLGVIFGVLGIVFSSQAKTAFNAGDMVQAESKSKNARLMCILGLVMIGIGAITSVIILALYGASIAAMFSELYALAL